ALRGTRRRPAARGRGRPPAARAAHDGRRARRRGGAMSRDQASRVAAEILTPVLAVLLALLCGGVLVLLVGRNPLPVYALLGRETFGSWYGFGQVLFKATTLVGTGLSVAVAFRAGLFNIGAE